MEDKKRDRSISIPHLKLKNIIDTIHNHRISKEKEINKYEIEKHLPTTPLADVCFRGNLTKQSWRLKL